MRKMIMGGAMLALAATAAVAMVPNAGIALAQTAGDAPVVGPIDGVINIPWGLWISQTAETLIWVLGAVIAWGMTKLPARVVAFLQTAQVEQLLNKAIDFAIHKTAGAVKGEALSFQVANQVLETALEYALAYAPAWAIKWLDGNVGIRDRLIARIPVQKDVSLK